MLKHYYYSCVGTPNLDELIHIVEDNIEITWEEFSSSVNPLDLSDLLHDLGYCESFPISKDWHVHFFKSNYAGEDIYFFVHSAVEYIFK